MTIEKEGRKRDRRGEKYICVGESVVRKIHKTLSNGEDVVVCLPGARMEHVTETVENILAHGHRGSVLLLVGTHNADRQGTIRLGQICRPLVWK